MPASKTINSNDWIAERKRFAIDKVFLLIQGCTNALLTFAFPRVSNQSPHLEG
jgi:hypothetical protein